MLGSAFMQAAFNVANSLGALFGGLPLLFGYDYNYPALVGAFMAFLDLFYVCYFIKNMKNNFRLKINFIFY